MTSGQNTYLVIGHFLLLLYIDASFNFLILIE